MRNGPRSLPGERPEIDQLHPAGEGNRRNRSSKEICRASNQNAPRSRILVDRRPQREEQIRGARYLVDHRCLLAAEEADGILPDKLQGDRVDLVTERNTPFSSAAPGKRGISRTGAVRLWRQSAYHSELFGCPLRRVARHTGSRPCPFQPDRPYSSLSLFGHFGIWHRPIRNTYSSISRFNSVQFGTRQRRKTFDHTRPPSDSPTLIQKPRLTCVAQTFGTS